MVFVFGIDIPLIELMIGAIAFMIVVLFFAILNLVWINRKEQDVITTEDALDDLWFEMWKIL